MESTESSAEVRLREFEAVSMLLREAGRRLMNNGPAYQMIRQNGLPCVLGFVGHVLPDRLVWLEDLLKVEFARYETAVHAEHEKLATAGQAVLP